MDNRKKHLLKLMCFYFDKKLVQPINSIGLWPRHMKETISGRSLIRPNFHESVILQKLHSSSNNIARMPLSVSTKELKIVCDYILQLRLSSFERCESTYTFKLVFHHTYFLQAHHESHVAQTCPSLIRLTFIVIV